MSSTATSTAEARTRRRFPTSCSQYRCSSHASCTIRAGQQRRTLQPASVVLIQFRLQTHFSPRLARADPEPRRAEPGNQVHVKTGSDYCCRMAHSSPFQLIYAGLGKISIASTLICINTSLAPRPFLLPSRLITAKARTLGPRKTTPPVCFAHIMKDLMHLPAVGGGEVRDFCLLELEFRTNRQNPRRTDWMLVLRFSNGQSRTPIEKL